MNSHPLDEFEAEVKEAVFVVAFGIENGDLCMSAAGDLDDPEVRESVVVALRDLADKIEGVRQHHGRTH